MNHGRSNVPIRHCPNCGEIVNKAIQDRCDENLHAARLKERNSFCRDCGKNLRDGKR
jgi:ribosomal protein S27AE